MNSSEIKKACLKLMETSEVAYLSTIHPEGYPEIRAVYNFRFKKQFPNMVNLFKDQDDDFLVYLTTDTSSQKMKQIRTNPNVSIYYCSMKDWHTLLLVGKVEVITDLEIKKSTWQGNWSQYYKGGVEDPEYTILKITPFKAKGWKVTEAYEFKINGDK